MRWLRALKLTVLTLAVLGLVLLGYAYWTAISDPVVRRAEIGLPGWPEGAPPLRAVLISDIHVAGPDMPPSRLERIVAQINALEPDIVLIAGDLVSDKGTATRFYGFMEAMAPLAGSRSRLGSFAVMGNHDHWRSSVEAHRALAAARVRVIDNDAVQIGPLALGGLDDDFTGRADVPRTVAAMRRLPGARLMLSHSPDPFPRLPGDVTLMLAGHAHCGRFACPSTARSAAFPISASATNADWSARTAGR